MRNPARTYFLSRQGYRLRRLTPDEISEFKRGCQGEFEPQRPVQLRSALQARSS